MDKIIYIFLLVLNFLLFIAVLSNSRMNRQSILFYGYLLTAILGLPGSYISMSGDWWLRNVPIEKVEEAYIIFQLFMVYFSLVVYVFMRYTKLDVPLDQIRLTNGIQRLVFPFFIVLSILLLLFVYLPDSALLFLIKNPDSAKLAFAKQRGMMGFYFQGGKLYLYYRNIILGAFMYFIYAYYFILYRKYGWGKLWMLLALSVLVLNAIIDLSKAPLIILIAFHVILLIRSGWISFPLFKYVMLSAIILVSMYNLVMDTTLIKSLGEISHRIFVTQYLGFPTALEVFPDYKGFLGITSISGQVSSLLGVDYNSYSRILMEFADPVGVQKGTAGYMSTLFMAESYAIGGLKMLIIGALTVPLYLFLIDYIFNKIPDLLLQSFYALLLIRLPFVMIDSFTRLFFNVELLVAFLLLFAIYLINRRYMEKTNIIPV